MPGVMSARAVSPRRFCHRLAAAAWLLAAACGPENGVALDPDTPRPKVVLIGIDGATWDVIDPMMARGELPNLKALVERGLRGPLLGLPPHSSPIVWTTFATGTFPRSHQILGFTYPYVPGDGRPVSSDLRRDPAIWNVATAHGKRVGIVGYFVTHPPDVVEGFMLSDLTSQFVPGSSWPPELQQELKLLVEPVWRPPLRDELFRRFLPWDYDARAAEDPQDPYQRVSRVVSKRFDMAILRDEIFRRLSLELVDREVDLFACYFRLVDHASHSTWKYFDDTAFDEPVDPFDKQLLKDVLPESYRWVDAVVGELVARCGEDVNLIVISDHGFGPGTGEFTVLPEKRDVISGNHRANGIFLAAGPDIAQGSIDGLTTMEIAPMLLALTGLPISDQLPGRLEQGVFRPGYLAERPVTRVPRWQVEWEQARTQAVPEAATAQSMETLRELGYIGEDVQGGGAPDGGELDFWSIGSLNRDPALVGELIYYMLRDDAPRARRLMELARRHDPSASKLLPRKVREELRRMEEALQVAPGSLTKPETLRQAGLAE